MDAEIQESINALTGQLLWLQARIESLQEQVSTKLNLNEEHKEAFNQEIEERVNDLYEIMIKSGPLTPELSAKLLDGIQRKKRK